MEHVFKYYERCVKHGHFAKDCCNVCYDCNPALACIVCSTIQKELEQKHKMEMEEMERRYQKKLARLVKN